MRSIVRMHPDPVEDCRRAWIYIITVISITRSLWYKCSLTPAELETSRPFIDRASRRTVNQVIVKEMTKKIKENIVMKKLPNTKWTGEKQ